MKVLVTGGGGFLGLAIVLRLVARGDQVTSLSRQRYPALEALGVNCVQADLADAARVYPAVMGMEAVIHVAAKAGIWGPWADFYQANVIGTETILGAARAAGVERFVYTSSPSVIFDGADQNGWDESAPYPAHYNAHYPRSKALAERLVLAAANADLGTVALRPHLIWGPGDPHFLPRLRLRAAQGRLVSLVRAEKLVDAVYVDNAADAHILALDRLRAHSPLSGRAIFITNHEPWSLRRFIDAMLSIQGLPPIKRHLPYSLAYALGAFCEGLYTVTRQQGDPPLTRFLVQQLATSHWYKNDLAIALIGYQPKISMDEGLRQLALSTA